LPEIKVDAEGDDEANIDLTMRDLDKADTSQSRPAEKSKPSKH